MNDLIYTQLRNNFRLTLPEGLNDLMHDISREVLRAQPSNIHKFIADYLSALLITREHLDLAAHVCGELCKNVCHEDLKDELEELGLSGSVLCKAHKIIVNYLDTGKGKEVNVMGTLIEKLSLDESILPELLKCIRQAYLKQKIEKPCDVDQIQESSSEESDEITKAVNHTMKIYKASKPTQHKYDRMATKIQAAYKGYKVRRSVRISTDSSSNEFKDIFRAERLYSSPQRTSTVQLKFGDGSENSFKKVGAEETERAVFDYTNESNFDKLNDSMTVDENKTRDSLLILRRKITNADNVAKLISFNRFPSIIPIDNEKPSPDIDDLPNGVDKEEIEEDIKNIHNNSENEEVIEELAVKPTEKSETSDDYQNNVKEVQSLTKLSKSVSKADADKLIDILSEDEQHGVINENVKLNLTHGVDVTDQVDDNEEEVKVKKARNVDEEDENIESPENKKAINKIRSRKGSAASHQIYEVDYQTHNSEASLSDQVFHTDEIINHVSYDDIEMNASDDGIN